MPHDVQIIAVTRELEPTSDGWAQHETTGMATLKCSCGHTSGPMVGSVAPTVARLHIYGEQLIAQEGVMAHTVEIGSVLKPLGADAAGLMRWEVTGQAEVTCSCGHTDGLEARTGGCRAARTCP